MLAGSISLLAGLLGEAFRLSAGLSALLCLLGLARGLLFGRVGVSLLSRFLMSLLSELHRLDPALCSLGLDLGHCLADPLTTTDATAQLLGQLIAALV